MSKKPTLKPPDSLKCSHAELILTTSIHASKAGYKQPSLEQRIAATTPSGSVKAKFESKARRDAESSGTFPAPLVLPNDDLALDATYPLQSLRAWVREKDRNKVTVERKTVYLAAPPKIDQRMEFMSNWGQALADPERTAKIRGNAKTKGNGNEDVARPDVEEVRGYLEAFYHGLPVKLLSNEVFKFSPKVDDLGSIPTSNLPDRRIIGLCTQTESGSKGIRSRPTLDGLFSHQLNLDDLLDAAISALPDDAYALLLLVEQDLYEDEEDEFVCGRAYGRSKVAVISMARYDPVLDERQNVGRLLPRSLQKCGRLYSSAVFYNACMWLRFET